MDDKSSNHRQSTNVPIGKWLTGFCSCGAQPSTSRSRCSCLAIQNTPVDRPDLSIYSQVEELAIGRVPSWNSPDITTNYWPPLSLMPEAIVRIHNLSSQTPAINALVHYYVSPFGIGTVRRHMVTRTVNIAPNNAVDLLFPLDQAAFAGDPRVGVHIEIEHPHDSNLVNNYGSQVVDAGITSEIGRSHSVIFPVLNNSNFTREIQLSIMATDILATVTPASHTFSPLEQIMVTLQLDVPDFLHSTSADELLRAVTVIGRISTGELIGGLTKLLRIDN